MVVWSPKVSGMANVRTDQIKIRPSDNTVLAATHGRGMFTTIWNVDYTAGIDDTEFSDKISIYPNPSDGEFSVSFTGNGSAEITISDMAGRIIYEDRFESAAGMVKSINIKNESTGIYLVMIKSGSTETSSRVLIQ